MKIAKENYGKNPILDQLKNLGIKFCCQNKDSSELPPLPEQERIASILSQIDETIEKEENYKEKLERIKQGLMDDLLTGKVRVNNLIEEQENYIKNKEV